MKKCEKRELLGKLGIIREKQPVGLFTECLGLLREVLAAVEALGQPGEKNVEVLREYLEMLIKAESTGSASKALRKQLVKAENAVRSINTTGLEIVFFPYKAEMWDSLESVWLAAREDPDCDVYVVPLPSYERLPDESLGDERYDGDRYPDYVPVTDWRTYDVENRRPDIIFTHYAYDDLTRNASIPAEFYSPRLRENCRLLMHIPYFVHGGYKVHDYDALIPGIIYANRVVLESEDVRQQYMEHYGKIYRQYRMKGQYEAPEEKFIAIGSPKFDKVINADRLDYKLPEEWERLIYRPDGSAKKIILFNTHMYTWINTGEQYFKKLRSVFETFSKRDDVLLWWRPHPQTELNFKTQAADKYSEYIQLTEDFKQSGIGIYDETQDAHCAIAWSDVYYGDASSLVALYTHAGKPCVMQDVYIRESRPLFNGLYDSGEQLWFCDANLNALFKLNKATWNIELAASFGESDRLASFAPGWSGRLFNAPVQCNGALFCVPFRHSAIARYRDGKISYIPFPEANMPENAASFNFATVYGDCVFFVPIGYPGILRLNTATEEVAVYSGWVGQINEHKGSTAAAFFRPPAVVGDTMWLASCHTNMVVEFNMQSCTYRLHEVGGSANAYGGCCWDGEHLWLAPLGNTPMIRWNPQTGALREYIVLINKFEGKVIPYCAPVYCEGHVWLMPQEEQSVLKIDVHTGEVAVSEEFESDYKNRQVVSSVKYLWSQTAGSSIFAYNRHEQALVEYNCATKVMRKEKLAYPEGLLPEDSLPEGLDNVLGNCVSSAEAPRQNETAGSAIYAYAKSCIS